MTHLGIEYLSATEAVTNHDNPERAFDIEARRDISLEYVSGQRRPRTTTITGTVSKDGQTLCEFSAFLSSLPPESSLKFFGNTAGGQRSAIIEAVDAFTAELKETPADWSSLTPQD